MPNYKILISTPSKKLAEMLTVKLDAYQFDIIHDSKSIVNNFHGYSLLIISGSDIDLRIKSIRRSDPELPIMAVTIGHDLQMLIKCFTSGADDTINAQITGAELLARVMRLIKRPPRNTSKVWEYGELLVDLDRRMILRDSEELSVRKKEFAILKVLLESEGRVLSRDEIINRTGEYYSMDIYPGTIDVHVSRLRKAIGQIDGHEIIETVHGIGYRISNQLLY